MPRVSLSIVLALAAAACGANPAPTAPSVPTATPGASLVPLPQGVSGIPAAENQFTAVVDPVSPPEELEVGVAVDYTLGHCGLGTPIDVDGSLWDPIGSSDALTEPQAGELINGTPVVIVLISEDTMQLMTPLGAVVTLARHDGERRYSLCD